MPHAPQCAASSDESTHAPAHSSVGAAHDARQTLAAHCWLPAQVAKQVPQWRSSVARSRQVPPQSKEPGLTGEVAAPGRADLAVRTDVAARAAVTRVGGNHRAVVAAPLGPLGAVHAGAVRRTARRAARRIAALAVVEETVAAGLEAGGACGAEGVREDEQQRATTDSSVQPRTAAAMVHRALPVTRAASAASPACRHVCWRTPSSQAPIHRHRFTGTDSQAPIHRHRFTGTDKDSEGPAH